MTLSIVRAAAATPAYLLAVAILLYFPATTAAESGGNTRGPLDGMVFKGHIGPADSVDLPDKLYFEGGRFWSGECVRCGFEPGVYWLRYLDNGIAFRGVLHSAERGTFTYEGRIRGDEIDVTINWQHERWYWTIDRELHFVGKRLQDVSTTMSLEEARHLARSGAPRPERCPS